MTEKYEEAYALACMPAFEKTREEDYKKIINRLAPERESRRRYNYVWTVAFASLAVLFGTFFFLQRKSSLDLFRPMVITANNGTGTEAVLPDGSRVRLNAQSTLRLGNAFGRKWRDVTLDGEGFFEVAHDSKTPFRVHTSGVSVTVKGTTFNVRSYGDEPDIEVSLFEGAVDLNTPVSGIALSPGYCAVVNRDNNNINITGIDLSASAWTKGKFVFEDKSIPQILRSVGRNYGVSFVYEENLFSSERFTGILSFSLSIDEILSSIDVDRKYSWNRQDAIIEIYRK